VDQAHRKHAGTGFEHKADLTIKGSNWQAPVGKLADVLEGEGSWWPVAITAAQANRDAQDLPILPLACLVLMKLRAGRCKTWPMPRACRARLTKKPLQA